MDQCSGTYASLLSGTHLVADGSIQFMQPMIYRTIHLLKLHYMHIELTHHLPIIHQESIDMYNLGDQYNHIVFDHKYFMLLS